MNLLAWASSLSLLIGNVLLAKKCCGGWLFNLFGCCGWATWAAWNNADALLFINLCFGMINAYGLLEWAREEEGK